MRLADLDATLIDRVTATGHWRRESIALEGAQGVLLQCPSCGAGLERGEEDGRRFIKGAHYMMVLFANPRGVEPAPADAGPVDTAGARPRWTITGGTSLEDLSLSPSINLDIPWKDAQGVQHPSSCKFHGHVTLGDAK